MFWRKRCPCAVAGVVVALSACASGNRLHEFDFRDRSLAVVSDVPRRPEILSGPLFIRRSGDPIRDLTRLGTRVIREIEARDVRDRLDQAASRIDVGEVLAAQTLERSARYLGARPIERSGDEDYLLEFVVVEYGIDAEAWDATAYFYIDADATLIDVASGAEIWREEIGSRDPIGPEIYGPRRAIRDVVTAAVLADLEVDEIVVALEALAHYSAREITDRLRDDLRESRRR